MFLIGTNTFFKMLGFDCVPDYSESLVEEVAAKLKARFEWVRMRNSQVAYTPRVKRRTITLELFEMRTQRTYKVLMGSAGRPFQVLDKMSLEA